MLINNNKKTIPEMPLPVITESLSKPLEAVIRSWDMTGFKANMMEAFRSYWIKPVQHFYVSYDWLSAKGFFQNSKNFKPYASFMPLLYRLMEAPEYDEKDTDAMRSWEEITAGLAQAMKTGKKYLSVFSKEAKLRLLMDEATESLFSPYNLTPSQMTTIWGDIAYDTRCKPSDFHPFLMPHHVYESFVNTMIRKYIKLRSAFEELAQGVKEAGMPPIYSGLSPTDTNLPDEEVVS